MNSLLKSWLESTLIAWSISKKSSKIKVRQHHGLFGTKNINIDRVRNKI